MRIGKAQGLRWSDVKLEAGHIEVSDRLRRLKTTSSVRMVPVVDEVRQVLEQIRRTGLSGHADLVFQGHLGSRGAYHALRSYCVALGIQHTRIHDLRHTFGVHGAQAGVPLTRLQSLLGHSNPMTTLRYMRHAPENYMVGDGASIAAGWPYGSPSGGRSLPTPNCLNICLNLGSSPS